MATIWLVSDWHLSHAATLQFHVPRIGGRMRSFMSVEDMDETIIARHNEVVRSSDKVYMLGDVTMRKEFLPLVARMHGHKRLVRGNHDIFPTKDYLTYFEEIHGVRVLEGLVLSHIPLHPESVKPQWVNVHGHVHNNVAQGHFGPQYLNVCVEMTDYRPWSLEECRTAITQLRERITA